MNTATHTLSQARDHARSLFESHGIPSTRHEDWKYTNLSRLSAWFDGEQTATTELAGAESINTIDGLDAYRMVIIGGMFSAEHSDLPQQAEVKSLSQLLKDTPEKAQALFELDTQAPLFNGVLAATVATASEGFTVCIPDNVQLDKPLYVIYVGGAPHMLNGVMLGRGAEASVIEHFVDVGEGISSGVSNGVTYIRLGAQASLTHYRLQQEATQQTYVGRVEVNQQRDSRYRLHAVELGASLSRSDIVVCLSEQGAECTLNGLFVAGGRQHIDHHTRIDHVAPHCQSRENYRMVLDGRSHGVFNGKVVVHEGASKTDSAQSNANLLLSDKAEVDTKPELEIYNDDVKCAHGATVGQLDEKQLFYMRSRGLSEDEARELLTFAFADTVLADMDQPTVRCFVEKAAFAKLPHMSGLEGILG